MNSREAVPSIVWIKWKSTSTPLWKRRERSACNSLQDNQRFASFFEISGADSCMSLVEGPFELKYHNNSRPKLRSFALFRDEISNQQVLILNYFNRTSYSMLDTLALAFLDEEFYRALLWLLLDTSVRDAACFLPNFLLLLAVWTWQENAKYLDYQIKRISFGTSRWSDADTNKELHDLREDLHYLKSNLPMLWNQIQNFSQNERSCNSGDSRFYERALTERNKIDLLESNIKDLERLVMETFQLLISTLSAEDNRRTFKQGRRANLIHYSRLCLRTTLLRHGYLWHEPEICERLTFAVLGLPDSCCDSDSAYSVVMVDSFSLGQA